MQGSRFKLDTRRAATRGFSMAELMAVVAIVGILSMIGITSYRKYVAHAKTAEVLPMFANIKMAEEAYKDETFTYLGPSANLDSDVYPENTKPGLQKMLFAGGAKAKVWQQLGVQATAPVLFVYACQAGTATDNVPAPGTGITIGNWPTTVAAPWYVVKARADIHGDGVPTVFVTSSFAGDLFSAHD